MKHALFQITSGLYKQPLWLIQVAVQEPRGRWTEATPSQGGGLACKHCQRLEADRAPCRPRFFTGRSQRECGPGARHPGEGPLQPTCSPPAARGTRGLHALPPPGLGRRGPPGLAAAVHGLCAVQGLEDSGDLQHDRARLRVIHPLGAVQRVLEHVFKCCGDTQSCWGTAPARATRSSGSSPPGSFQVSGTGNPPQPPAPRISSADTEAGVVTVGRVGRHARIPWHRDSGKQCGNSY